MAIIKSEKLNRGKESNSKKSLSSFGAKKPGQKKIISNKILLLDKSSSMSDTVGGMTKWDHLLHAVKVNFSNSDAKCVCFGSYGHVDIIDVDDLPTIQPGGSTAMHFAFFQAFKANFFTSGQFDSIICISDGAPDNEREALTAALKLGVKVDTIFIGDDIRDKSGAEFMKRLAKETGGGNEIVKDSAENLRFLTSAIAGFLSPPVIEL